MSKRYEVIKQFLDVFSVFEQTVSDDAELTFDNFLGYALENASTKSALAYRKVAGELGSDVLQQKNKKEDSIAILVAYLYRYAKQYVKKALQDSPLQSIDDFSYLIVLLTHDSLSKTELINKNVHEKTTGMEIIKRLVKTGLMVQYDDVDDKRSQRIAISPEGRKVVYSILGNMGDVSRIMSANLTENEKSILIYLLKKLDQFHFDIFTHDRNESLQGIIQTRIKDE
jgi:DNA-binding MarR family transcriptional regulator